MRLLVLPFICVLAGLVGLPACQSPFHYEQTVQVPTSGWHQDSTYVFHFKVEDISKSYSAYYNVRHTLDYPFYNFFIQYRLCDSTGAVKLDDRQEMILMDPATGKPLGSGVGGTYNKDFTGLEGIRFTAPGKYSFKVSQQMRQNPLPGISAFTFRVEKQP